MDVEVLRVDWQFSSTFRIAYREQTEAQTVWVVLKDMNLVGHGEALGVSYYGEDIDSMLTQLRSIEGDLRHGLSRANLQAKLPPGGARNAVDCALWDLEAKRAGRRAWDMAEIRAVSPLLTAYTLSMDTPEMMAAAARNARGCSLLKRKLSGEGDLKRVAAVRKARPAAGFIVDANQAWDEQQLIELTPQLHALGVTLIEQPLPVGQDDVLLEFVSPVPLCGRVLSDHSQSVIVGWQVSVCQHQARQDGGLTEALRLTRTARVSS